MSDYKLEVKNTIQTAHAQRRIAQLCQKLNLTAIIFALCRKSELLHLFALMNLWP